MPTWPVKRRKAQAGWPPRSSLYPPQYLATAFSSSETQTCDFEKEGLGELGTASRTETWLRLGKSLENWISFGYSQTCEGATIRIKMFENIL